MTPTAILTIETVSNMIVGKELFDPSADAIALCGKTTPKLSGPIFANKLIAVARDGTLNAELVCTLVDDLFSRVVHLNKRTLFKHMQMLTLSVVRLTAVPEDTPYINWTRAAAAAHFCMGTSAMSHEKPPSNPSDAIWRMLGLTQCPSNAGASARQRRNNWYSMMVRIVIGYTARGEWQEAHAAMRKNADLVPEIVAQIKAMERSKCIATTTLEVARNEMCMPPLSEAAQEADPLTFEFDADFLGEVIDFDSAIGIAPEDVVVVLNDLEQATPPKAKGRGRPRKVTAESSDAAFSPVTPKRGSKKRVAPPVVFKERRVAQLALLCDESSKDLLEETANWSSQPAGFVNRIIASGYIPAARQPFDCKWMLDETAICPTNLTLKMALGHA